MTVKWDSVQDALKFIEGQRLIEIEQLKSEVIEAREVLKDAYVSGDPVRKLEAIRLCSDAWDRLVAAKKMAGID